MKTKRTCSSEGCDNPHFAKGFCQWHQYKRSDLKKPAARKQCSSEGCKNPIFGKGYCQQHQFKRPDFKKPEFKQTPIKKKSDKLKKAESIYSRKKKAFLKKKENQVCPVAFYFMNQKNLSVEEQLEWSRNLKTTDVHHKAGRIGDLLLDVSYWLAVSRKGHTFIHDNPEFSYSKGWLIKSTTV